MNEYSDEDENVTEGGKRMVGGSIVLIAVVGGFLVFLVLLFAPIKLYSIHNEIKYTNELLKFLSGQLTQLIAEQSRVSTGVIAALSPESTGGSLPGQK